MLISSKNGQKINNFFTIITIGLMSIVMYIYFKYIKAYEKSPVLACLQETVYFDKLYDEKLNHQIFSYIQNGKYTIKSGFVESVYMPSKLKNIVQLQTLDQAVQSKLPKKISSERFAQIHYEVVENDKADPHKKANSPSCKNYAGYVLVSFKLNGQTAYKIQIDFMTYNMEEIQNKLFCAMEAFNTYAKPQ